jgi:hypothetical protein
MNKQGREQLTRACALLDEARSIVESVGEEEQEKFDNLSEGLQAAERGQRIEEVASTLAEQVEAIGDVLTAIEEAQE